MTSDGQSFFYCGSIESGIYRGVFEEKTGEVSGLTLLPGTPQSFFLAAHPSLPVLYSLDIKGGKVGVFAIARDGGLTLLQEVDSEGAAPCHLAVDPAGRYLPVANYNGGFSLFALGADGGLFPASSVYLPTGSSADAQRQSGPHPHGVALRGDLIYGADLGIDRILALRVELDPLRLTPVPELDTVVAAGAGPRHFTLHPNGCVAAAVNELDNTVTAFRLDPATGRWQETGTLSTLPEGFDGESWTAELEFHPSADVFYATNRGHDSLAIFAIDPVTAEIRAVRLAEAGGAKPQHVAFAPSGGTLFVANSEANAVALFRVDRKTGLPLVLTGELSIPAPMCSLIYNPR